MGVLNVTPDSFSDGGRYLEPAAALARARTLVAEGATIVDVDLPLSEHGIATYYIIAPAEAASNLARYDGIRYGHRARFDGPADLFDLYARSRAEGFGPEVQRRIMLGTYVLSAGYAEAFYNRALKVRRLIRDELEGAFRQERLHAVIGPTAPGPAFAPGEKADPLSMYLCDLYTVNANIAALADLSTATSPIDLVDLYDGFDPDRMGMADGIHPNDAGDAFIADRIARALLARFGRGH